MNSFTISPSKWIEETNAIGIVSKSGRYDSGTYAHEDIALEFASWISAEFKLYFIKEFRRLKHEENERLKLGWNVKRELVKINYKIHTDAIKENLIPPEISAKDAKIIYASEADVLNKALFGKTVIDALLTLSFYPFSVYSGATKFVLLFIIPADFVTGIPVELLKEFSWKWLGITLGFSVLFSIFAVWFFYQGLRKYESGNIIAMRG